MARLIKLARSPYPLPLAGLKTEHSLLGLDNLVEAVDKVLSAEAPLKRPLIVADPKPLTIAAMIAAMRQGLGRRAALFYVPKPLLRGALRAAGQAETCAPLFGLTGRRSFGADRLNWVPPIETAADLPRSATRRLRDAASQYKRDDFVHCEARSEIAVN
jgi:UDP-glucose 4-epimerase